MKSPPNDLNFIELKQRFDQALSNGDRAELRRSREPQELPWVPATYRLLPPGQRPNDYWQRAIFFLPWLAHREGADAVGKALAASNISQTRLFQVLRSEAPNDLVQFRRLCQQAKPTVDWSDFGRTVFFWSKSNKQRIIEDYYLAGGGKDKSKKSKSPA